MKHSETKLPKGTTHIRLTTPEGKSSTVKTKAVSTLDGTAGTLTFFRMVKNKLNPIDMAPHGKPETVVLVFRNQKDGTQQNVRLINDSAKEKGRALKALGAKFKGGTWGLDGTGVVEANGAVSGIDIDLTILAVKKAKASNVVPPVPAAAVAEKGKETEKSKSNKGTLIEALLTTQKVKLSTLLDKVMAAYPEGNAARTLARIRKVAVTLKKGNLDLKFIDEPDFKASK